MWPYAHLRLCNDSYSRIRTPNEPKWESQANFDVYEGNNRNENIEVFDSYNNDEEGCWYPLVI